jgi:sensor histidine kinase YesM
VHKQITVRDGLPSNETYQVYSDTARFLWVGSDRGVSRFDGRNFVTYTTNNGLPYNFVNKFFITPCGTMWVLSGAMKKNLAYFDGSQFVPYPYNYKIDSLLQGFSQILDAVISDEQELTIATNTHGFIKIDAQGNISQKTPLVEYNAMQVLLDTALHIGAACRMSDKRLMKSGQFEFHSKQYKYNAEVTFANYLRANDSVQLFSVVKFLFYLNNKNEVLRYDSMPGIINTIYQDKDKNVWVVSDPAGVLFYPKGNMSAAPKHFFTNYRISSVAQDYEGGYWFTTLTNGLIYAPSLSVVEVALPKLMPNEVPQALACNDDHDVLLGTNKAQIFQLQNDAWTTYTIEHNIVKKLPYFINSKSIFDVLILLKKLRIQNNFLYGNMVNLIYKMDLSTHQFTYYSMPVVDIIDDNDSIMIVNQTNLVFIKKDLKVKKSYPLPRPQCAFRSKDSTIYVGHEKGISYLKYDSMVVLEPAKIKERVNDIKQLENGTLVIATQSNGFYLYNNQTLINIKIPAESPNANIVNKIAVKGNSIFAATQDGVFYFDATTLDDIEFTAINSSSGYAIFSVNDIGIHQNECYFLSDLKLYRLNIATYKKNTQSATLALKNLLINKKQVAPETHQYTYTDNQFKFEFEAAAYQTGEQLTYQYALLKNENADTNWVASKELKLELDIELAGKYTLLARAKSFADAASVFQYNFQIPKPFYKTIWFLCLLFITIAMLVFMLVRWRIYEINQKNEQAQLMLSYEQQSLAQQINPHFIFNVINNIQSFILSEDKKTAYNYLNKFSKLMRLNLDNSRLKWVQLSTELELVRLYLELEKIRFDRFTFKIICDNSIDPNTMHIPSMLIQPYLENCIKHGIFNLKGREGLITCHLQMQNNNLLCSISDNGIGRTAAAAESSKQTHHTSAGQSITLKRLELLMAENKQENYFQFTDLHEPTTGLMVQYFIPYKLM